MLRSLLRRLRGSTSSLGTLAAEGSPAPDFRGTAHDGTTVSLGDFRGRTLLLWFYPRADTPGCTKEGCDLRDGFAELGRRGVAVVGCSFDDVPANRAFAEKFAFPFPLLCDTDRRIGLAYGACARPDAGHPQRISYLIDAKGVVRACLEKVDPATHAAEILSRLGEP